jgi:hypothetical protein
VRSIRENAFPIFSTSTIGDVFPGLREPPGRDSCGPPFSARFRDIRSYASGVMRDATSPSKISAGYGQIYFFGKILLMANPHHS